MRRLSATAVLLKLAVLVAAQNTDQGSPFSSFGFGDLLNSSMAPSAMMGGTGIAISEPFGIQSINPASYAGARQPELGGLQRPVFEGALRASFLTLSTPDASSTRTDAAFMGFNVGIPFGKGKWGLGLGVTPFSNVGYALQRTQPFEDGNVTYEYSGSGGLNRAFAGIGRVLWQQKVLDKDNPGARLVLGANFEYSFGRAESLRRTIYPAAQSYINTSASSALNLSAPTAGFGLHFGSQFVSAGKVAERIKARHAQRKIRYERWKEAHGGTIHPKADRAPREASAWRYTLGLVGSLPTRYNATLTQLNTQFFRSSTGSESVLDTLPSSGTSEGYLTMPASYGLGISVQDARWMFTAEARQRDWSALRSDVEGIAESGSLRQSLMVAFGARFTPAREGGFLQRVTYRIGARSNDEHVLVNGQALRSMAITGGLSVPLNMAQTNSYLHLGGEYGQRGTSASGSLQERSVALWIGVAISPLRGERWFRPYQIQ